MSMAQQELDYTTLKWVKDEIQESLNQTRQALEAYVENPSDNAQIRFCTTYLHQIYGTLQMVEIYGGALLAEEMELLASAIMQNKIARREEAYDVLMRAILQLPSYLEHLENGAQDLPVILLPLLNDLRSARGEHLLSENAFFSPNLSVPIPEDEGKKSGKSVDVQKYAKKLRPVYQASLVGLYRDKNTQESVRKLAIVIRELLFNSNLENSTRLWWVASALVEALLEGGIEASNSVKQLLGHLDRQIKRLIVEGEQVFAQQPPVELLKNLLYYVATSKSQGPRVGQVKLAFSLDKLLPGGGDINEAFASLRGSNSELMQSVAGVIKEDLLHVKDQLDIFVRSQDRSTGALEPLSDNLGRISDALAMLGLGDLHKIIQDQKKNIRSITQTAQSPTDSRLMEIASALLYVESSLDGVQSAIYTNQMRRNDARTESLLPPNEQKQLSILVISEAKKVLAEVKEHFNDYALDPLAREPINNTPELLTQVRGVLSILSLDHAANLLRAVIQYIESELLPLQGQPNQTALDLVADVITSIEYYLEAVAESRARPETILSVAEESISKLGYPVQRIEKQLSEVEHPKPISVEAVAAASREAQQAAKEQETVEIRVTDKPAVVALSTAAALPEDDIDEEILEIFIEEADEVVSAMKENLRTWRQNEQNEEALIILRRSYHTIKGSGRLAGAKVVGEFAWAIENMLNRVIDGRVKPDQTMFTVLEKAESALEECIAHLKGERPTHANIQPIVEVADAIASGNYKPGEPLLSFDTVAAQPAADESSVTQTIEIDVADQVQAKEKPALEEMEDEMEVDILPTQDPLLVDIFRKETEGHLRAMRDYIDKYPFNDDKLVTEALMRALHTLHGSAHMARVGNIANLSEHLDRYIRTLHDTKQPVDDEAMAVLKEGTDILTKMAAIFEDENPISFDTDALVTRVKALHEEAKKQEVPVDLNALDSWSIVPEAVKPPTYTVKQQAAEQPVKAPAGDGDEDAELTGIFLDEADDILKTTEALIQGWLTTPNDASIMEELQRALHTIKGGARMANLAPIASLSHGIESLLENIANGFVQPTIEYPRLVQNCQDWLVQAIDQVRQGASLEEPDALLHQLHACSETADTQQIPISSAVLETLDLNDAASPSATELEEFSLFDRFEEDRAAQDDLTVPYSSQAWPAQDPAPAEAQSMDEDEELLNIFVEEANDIQKNDEDIFAQWRGDQNNPEHISSLQRNLHTLKGGARMARISAVANVAHKLESLLEEVIEERLPMTGALLDLSHTAHDWFTRAITLVRQRDAVNEPKDLLTKITNYRQEHEVEAPQILEEATVVPLVQIEEKFDSLEATPAAAPAPSAPQSPEEYDEELVEVFLEEAEEIQDSTEKIIHEWSKDYQNIELIAEIQRALHTLKGGARMANIKPIGDLSHAIESLLEAVSEDRIESTKDFPVVVQACHDWLTQAIENVRKKQPLGRASSLQRQLENLLSGKDLMEGVDARTLSEGTESSPALSAFAEESKQVELIELPTFDNKDSADASMFYKAQPASAKSRGTDEQIRVKTDLLDELVNHAGEMNIYNARIGQQLGSWHFNLTELDQTVRRLREQLRKFEIETEAQIMYRHTTDTGKEADEQFDPLELDRFSYMQQLSRGMVESLNDLTSIQNILENTSSEADVLLLQQSRINGDLQEGLMSTRMTPFSSVIARLRREVRQTCQEVNKEADLKVLGAEGEMDRTQLNRVVTAIEHILRNAIDHGIEPAEVRRRAGKPENGTVEISLTREGSEVVLRISDDGAGIDIAALRRKAVERGLLREDSNVDDREIIEFILESGFSTAKQVTQISGRGVGMDVVNTEIKQLNGSLHIDSTPGKSSSFTIRLPLTVLVNQALMVQVDESTYALQLSHIEHVTRVTGDQLLALHTGEAKSYVFGGVHYQLLDVGYVLHGSVPKTGSSNTRHPLLLARSGDHRVALLVGQLLGRQEIVIKSVGPQLSSINSISGATIMPDGEVALILDLNTLVRTAHALEKVDLEARPVFAVAQPTPKEEEKAATILVVDDSITVRKVTQRLLARHNFTTLTAKDGVDALTVMLEQIPDLILLDIEMPRMDGYELATAVRNDERLKKIPIIMITSRSGEKHRERAMNIGVNMYMGKPFQEQELLENVQKLLQQKSTSNKPILLNDQ